MNVRFLKPYSPDWDINISYELVSDEIFYNMDGEKCYDLKLIGYVPIRKLEITNDENDVPAIDIWVKLSNL